MPDPFSWELVPDPQEHVHHIMGDDVTYIRQPVRIYVRLTEYDYDGDEIVLVTTDKAEAFKPLMELRSELRPYVQNEAYYELMSSVTVWQDNQKIEYWVRRPEGWVQKTT